MDNEYLISVLKEKRARLVHKIKQAPEYIELQKIKYAINILQEDTKESHELELTADPTGEKKVERKAFSKDMRNSPAADLPFGKRAEFMYELIEQIVKEAGGEAEISFIEKRIREDWNLSWSDPTGSRLVSYILQHNRRSPDDIRLGMWPKRKEGQKRVYRYKKIVALNNTFQLALKEA